MSKRSRAQNKKRQKTEGRERQKQRNERKQKVLQLSTGSAFLTAIPSHFWCDRSCSPTVRWIVRIPLPGLLM